MGDWYQYTHYCSIVILHQISYSSDTEWSVVSNQATADWAFCGGVQPDELLFSGNLLIAKSTVQRCHETFENSQLLRPSQQSADMHSSKNWENENDVHRPGEDWVVSQSSPLFVRGNGTNVNDVNVTRH